MKYDYTGEKFLDKIFKDIYLSDEVKHTASKSDKKEVAIKKYMDRLERVHNKARKADRIDLIKQLYFDKYVIKRDKLPYGLSETEKNNIIGNQKKRLSLWIDYLTDDNALYPMWAKYWAFQGMLKLGAFDEARGIYQRRSDKTIAPFVEANPEIISNCINDMMNYERSRLYPNEEVESILKAGSFKKLFEYYEKKFKSSQVYTSHSVKGEWIKYNQGSREDAIKLCDSLQNKGTGWCTANESFAINQVCGGGGYRGGDFYVYYTEDENGKCTVPRIAIRMNGKYFIGEIRGVENGQCLETDMIPILEAQLKSMNFVDEENIKVYTDKINDLKSLFNMYRKTVRKQELTPEEINDLYTKSYGFGWDVDTLVMKTIALRNVGSDFNYISDIEAKIKIARHLLRDYKSTNNFIITDKEFMIRFIYAISVKDPLRYASEELRKDKDIVIVAAARNGYNALLYVTEEMKDDEYIAHIAVKSTGRALSLLSNRLKNNRDIVLDAIKQDYVAFQYASEELRKNENFIISVIKKTTGKIFEFVGSELKNNKRVALAAIRNTPDMFNFVSDELKKDKFFIARCIEVTPNANVYEYLGKEFYDDKVLALLALKQDGSYIKYVSEGLRNDKEVILTATKQNYNSFMYASDRLKKDMDTVHQAIKYNGLVLEYASKKLRDNKNVALEAIKNNPWAIRYVSKRLLNDKDVALEAVKINGNTFIILDNNLCKDKDVALAAVENSIGALEFVDKRLLNDKDFLITIISENPRLIEVLHKVVKVDDEDVIKAIYNALALVAFDNIINFKNEISHSIVRKKDIDLFYLDRYLDSCIKIYKIKKDDILFEQCKLQILKLLRMSLSKMLASADNYQRGIKSLKI